MGSFAVQLYDLYKNRLVIVTQNCIITRIFQHCKSPPGGTFRIFTGNGQYVAMVGN